MSALCRWVVLSTMVSLLTGCGGCNDGDKDAPRAPGVVKTEALKKPSIKMLEVAEDAGTE